MILDEFFPPDIRVEKEAISLQGEGHEIHLICRNKKDQGNMKIVGGIIVHRLNSLGKLMDKMCGLLYSISFIHLRWLFNIKSIVKKYSIEVLHVHDLPMLLTSIIIGKILKIQVVYDKHERWPESIRSYQRKFRLRGILSRSYRWLKIIEKISELNSDYIICASEHRDKGHLLVLGIPDKKIVIVPNYPDIYVLDNIYCDRNIKEKYKNTFLIVYHGSFGKHRGIDVAIKAMPYVLQEIDNAILLLIGNLFINELTDLIKRLNMEDHVKILGWLEHSDVCMILKICNVCVIPFLSIAEDAYFDATHKIFEIMLMSKPFVITNITDYKERIDSIQCGIVVPPDSPKAISKAIIKLYKDKELATILGKNGRKAVEKKYNWNVGQENLKKLYLRIQNYL